jgi:transcriptional regulator with XRE-family HTH domain
MGTCEDEQDFRTRSAPRSRDSKQRSQRALLETVDRAVGTQLRLARLTLGLTQEEVGRAMEISFQQVQNYERGTNRVSASRLYQLAAILDVPISFFFESCAERAPIGALASSWPDNAVLLPASNRRAQNLEFLRTFQAVEDQQHRDAVLKLLRTMAPASANA